VLSYLCALEDFDASSPASPMTSTGSSADEHGVFSIECLSEEAAVMLRHRVNPGDSRGDEGHAEAADQKSLLLLARSRFISGPSFTEKRMVST